MKYSLSAAVLALAIGATPLAAQAKTDISIGIGINGAPVYAAPYYPPPPYSRRPVVLTQRDIERSLIGQGYRIDHIDRRGNSYFVRVVSGYSVYTGYVDCYSGRWMQRTRIGYYNPQWNNGNHYGWDKKWDHDRDHDDHDWDHDHDDHDWDHDHDDHDHDDHDHDDHDWDHDGRW